MDPGRMALSNTVFLQFSATNQRFSGSSVNQVTGGLLGGFHLCLCGSPQAEGHSLGWNVGMLEMGGA